MYEWKMASVRTAKYHGLMNQGATCYLNSVLQVLFMTEDFRERVKRSNAGARHIDKELRDLFIDLEEYVAYTYKITAKLKIKNVYEQRDAAEHYEKILRLTSPEASQIFHGELINTITCKKCNSKTESPAGFWQLPLPLVDNNNEYSVEKGIEDFFRQSEISGEDQMYCETCDEKCDAVLDCVVKHYPEVLVLLLKRFEMVFDGRAGRKVKINCPVRVPDTLHMEKTQIYKLYAHVEHFGELQCGHYIAKIKPQDDGQWYIFDDQNVEVSSYNHFQLDSTETSKYVYLLFYRRQKDNTFANMGRRDASVISPATPPSNRTKDEHSFSEKNEEDKTHSKDFRKNFPTKDQPARPESKIKIEKKRPGRDNLTIHSNDEENEAKRRKINRKDDLGQDSCHKKSQENFSGYDENNHSTLQNYTVCVKIEMPDDSRVKTSKNNKMSQNFDPVEDTKYIEARAERSYRDSNVKNVHLLSGVSTRGNSVDPQCAGGQWEDQAMTKSQQLRQVEYSSVEFSHSKDTWDKQHVRQHDTGEVECRKRDVQRLEDRNGLHKHDQRSHSGDPGQRIMHRNQPDRSVGRHHNFHGSGKQYYSQDVQLETFRKELQVNKMTNVGADAQNDHYKEHGARLLEEEEPYNGASEQKSQHYGPRQCLDRLPKTQPRKTQISNREQQSQRVNSARGGSHSFGRGDGECNSMERKSKNKNAKISDIDRNKSCHNISHRAEITPDSLAEDMKPLTLKDSSKTEEEPKTFNEVKRVVVLKKTRRKRSMWKCCWPRRKRTK